MNEKVREQFEAWAVTSAWLGLGHESEMARDGEGYAETEVHTAWVAWQASREWVEIKLPFLYPFYRQEVTEVLNNAGLKVKKC